MQLREDQGWFIHNEKEQIWTENGWGDLFAKAVVCRKEKDARRLAEALRVIYPDTEIGFNPMFEIYSIVATDKTKSMMEDYEYTANRAIPFTSFYGRQKLFYDYERAEREADRLWFEVFEENPDIEIVIVFAGGGGDLAYPSFSPEEQKEWFERRKREWEEKRGE